VWHVAINKVINGTKKMRHLNNKEPEETMTMKTEEEEINLTSSRPMEMLNLQSTCLFFPFVKIAHKRIQQIV
jgi:hypothetical protein